MTDVLGSVAGEPDGSSALPRHSLAGSATPFGGAFYEQDPTAALAWAAEYLVSDLKSIRADIASRLDGLDLKISLLSDILNAAIGERRERQV